MGDGGLFTDQCVNLQQKWDQFIQAGKETESFPNSEKSDVFMRGR